jgi:outer membrane protein
MSECRQLIALLLLLCTCLVPLQLAAEEARVIRCELQSCIQMAFANHPLLKASEARQAAARSQVDVQVAARRPTLNLVGESGYLSGKSISPFSALAGVTEEGIQQRRVAGGYYQPTVGLEAPLVKEGTLVGQTAASVRQAEFKVSEEDWAHRSLRLQVTLQVAEAYVDVLKHLKAVQLDEAIVAALEEAYQLALAKFNQHLISKNDLLLAEVQVATAKRDLSVAHLALRKGQRALASSMGLDQVPQMEIEDLQDSPAPLPPLERLVALARQTHPELRAYQFRVSERAEEIKRVRSAQYPTLSLTTKYGLVDAFEGRPSDQWNVALKVNVPIFDFGLIKSKTEVARANLAEEEKLLLDVQRSLEQAIAELYVHVQESEAEAVLINKQIEQAMEAVRLNQAMFQQNLLPQSAVLDTKAALQKLELALSNAEYDQKLARFQLRVVSGGWEIKEQ